MDGEIIMECMRADVGEQKAERIANYLRNAKFIPYYAPCSFRANIVHDCASDTTSVMYNPNCSDKVLAKAIVHEMEHIDNDDIYSERSVAEIESLRHK